MNHWYTVGLLADDHRADLDREAAGNARLKVAHSTAEPRPGAHDPDSGGPRRRLVNLAASIQSLWARRRAVSER